MGCSTSGPPAEAPTVSGQPPSLQPARSSVSSVSSVAPPPMQVSVMIPPGAAPGALLRFLAPDGRNVQITVPPNTAAGQVVTVQVPQNPSARKHGFTTLLEAFRHCDPQDTGNIKDRALFAKFAKSIADERGEVDVVWENLDQDGNGEVNFPEFVEWAQRHNVDLPIGVEGAEEEGGFSFPSAWTGPKDNPDWNERREVKDPIVFEELRGLLENSHKKVWTRDRKSTGINQVPDGYKLEKALKNENLKDWRSYYMKRHMMALSCATKPFVQHRAFTGQAENLSKRHNLRPYVNEWFLFHGTSAEAAKQISTGSTGSDFTMTLAGSASAQDRAMGTLYGRGVYFAESATKADEYAKPGPDGLCCILVCRVVGGYVLYTDEVTPDPAKLQEKVISGDYHSILGDREKCRNTFKEFVVFDADQIYVDYLLFYKRIFAIPPSK